jgi:hypothetical protein
MSRAGSKQRKPETYTPDPRLIGYLDQELEYMKTKAGKTTAGGTKIEGKRNEKSKYTFRKKSYRVDTLFQKFADITYFLKFIDEHFNELGESYKDVLEQFFGVLRSNPKEEEEEEARKGNQNAIEEKESNQLNPTPIFDEFIKGSLSLRKGLHANSDIDFRINLINIMIRNVITALQFLMSDSRLLTNMLQDSNRFSSYPEMLEEGLRERLAKQDRKIWRTYKI